MQTASKKVINGWAMYDWANSAYNLVITSTIFPAYYDAITTTRDAAGKIISHKVLFLGKEFESASLYNYAISFAYLVIAVISPILSSIADYKGNKKRFMQSTHKLPPLVPVNSYHCIHFGCVEKTFPNVNQGQLSSQFWWMYSNESQKKINER